MKFWPNQYISFKVVCVEGLLTRILNVLAEKNIIRSCQLNDQLETRSSSIFSEPADHSIVLNLQYSEVQHCTGIYPRAAETPAKIFWSLASVSTYPSPFFLL